MIFTILGSLLGLITSSIPSIIDFMKDRADKRHELELFKLQIEAAASAHTWRMAEVDAQADIGETQALYRFEPGKDDDTFIGALTRSVRPVITYAFFMLYCVLKISQFAVLREVTTGASFATTFVHVWSEQDMVLFATIVSFWFGQRQFRKLSGMLK